ncbi:carbohydrate sulfotransferase 1-like [Penaeus chinensis]|uniref:carbohydrate sulfotransferase 1-like n=1 Tax=Penaeus chinensis TaxID=139456 RepID=UPI001FB86160|nr:carbohydrate sulfotransferase 1-like [Penaeus chinensis]
MGLRGMLYRAARNRRVWTLVTVLFLFYVNIIQIANMTRSEEESRTFEWKRAKPKQAGDSKFNFFQDEDDQDVDDNLPDDNDMGDVRYNGYYYQDDEAQAIKDGDYDEGDPYADEDVDEGDDNDGDHDEEEREDGDDGYSDNADYGDAKNRGREEENNRNKESNREDTNVIKMEPAGNMIKKEPAEQTIKWEPVENIKQEFHEEKDGHAETKKNNGENMMMGGEKITGGDDDIYNGYYNTQEKVKKVLLVTYQRSGSSFVGELLTSGGGAMYVYEPLFLWRALLGPGADVGVEERAARALGDLLDCKPEVVRAWRRRPYQYFRRKPEGVRDWCVDADLRLLKTIRARASFVLPWMRSRSDIKVVHLVRDPRGILNSVKRGGNLWSENNRNAALQCANIERDLQLQELGPHRYLQVRYEDLVESPLEETRRIFSFMGANFNDDVMAYLREHTWLAEKIPAEKQGYLKTFRDSSFKHDHWKTNMDNREIEFIESVCGSVMKKLNYHPLPPT